MNYIDQAITIFNQGGIVIFPTDTAFGIGCRIDKPGSIKKLFQLRRRPETQATPVLVSSVDMALSYYKDSTEEVMKLMKTYWPGALTIVYNSQTEKIPELVRGGTETIGLRMPNHPDVLEIIKNIGVPILGPSANFHGNATPFTVEELDSKLIKLVDFVLPGECRLKQASTVIDCTLSPAKILRQGVVILQQS